MHAESPPGNIEQFNRIVAIGLLQLYEAFPMPIDLNADDVAAKAGPANNPDVDFHWQLTDHAQAALEFLSEEGFIRYASNQRHAEEYHIFHRAQLTVKGLAILGAVPSVVDEQIDRRPIADQLKEGVRRGAVDVLAKAVGSIFGAAMGLGM